MNRLIVTNSALAYPPPPPSVAGPDDVVLPLVETFEEALFMPSPFYEELYDEVPDLNRRARALAREMSALLPAAVAEPRPEWGHSAWEVFADSFVKFSLGPVMVNSLLAERAVASKPQEVIAWEEPGHASWWSGRQMVAEIAGDIARASDARLRLRSGSLRRTAMKVTRAPATCAQARLRFLKRLRRPQDMAREHFDVVFAIVSATLTPIFEKVREALEREHDLRVLGVEVPLRGSAVGIGGRLLPHTNLHAYSTPGMIARANLEVCSSWRWQAHFKRALSGFEELAGLPPGARAVLLRRMHNALIRDLPAAMYHSRLWRRFLDIVQPRAVVSFNSYNPMLAPSILQAKARGIPTLDCQHGICGPLFLAGTLLPYDDVLVFGEYSRDMLRRIASPGTSFSITGHSPYDYRTLAVEVGSKTRANNPVVLATTQPIEKRLRLTEPCFWLEALADACEKLGAKLVIKAHPQETDLELYRALARARPDVVTFVAHGERPLEELIAECEVLATRFSTTAMEANLAGKLVLTVNVGGGPEQYPYAEEGAALAARSCEGILPALRALLTDEATQQRLQASRQRFVDRHVGPLDGKATERIAAIIAGRAGAVSKEPPSP